MGKVVILARRRMKSREQKVINALIPNKGDAFVSPITY